MRVEMPKTNVFEVRFEQIAQKATAGRFSVPKSVVGVLGINARSPLLVEISSRNGVRYVETSLKSGNEIYGELDAAFDKGELISIRITKLRA